jgi:hypothetical protein
MGFSFKLSWFGGFIWIYMDLYGFIASFQILTENVLLNFDEWSPAWLQCISTSGNKDQLNGDPLACWLLWRYWQGTLLHRRISRAMWVCDWVAKQNEHRIPKKKRCRSTLCVIFFLVDIFC